MECTVSIARFGRTLSRLNWEWKYWLGFKNWRKKFAFIYKSTKDNKLKQFSSRILHRIVMTKKELFKFRLVEDEMCTLCLRPDSIEHTFLDWTVTTAFYLKAISWVNHENDTVTTLSNKQIAFNDIPRLTQLTDYPRRRLHLFVIVLKNTFTPVNVWTRNQICRNSKEKL